VTEAGSKLFSQNGSEEDNGIIKCSKNDQNIRKCYTNKSYYFVNYMKTLCLFFGMIFAIKDKHETAKIRNHV
jgi:hypothetical protein